MIGKIKGWVRVRNSWGTEWGDKGYAWFPQSYLLNPKYFEDNGAVEVVSYKKAMRLVATIQNCHIFEHKSKECSLLADADIDCDGSGATPTVILTSSRIRRFTTMESP